MKKYSRVRAEISLDAIEHNFKEMKKNIREGTKIIAVIKADAYGHGAKAISQLIHEYDYIWGFATATAEEALALRKYGVTKPILILGLVFEEHFQALAENDIHLSVSDVEMAEKFAESGRKLGRECHVHIALDTGMTRIGFSDTVESVGEIQKISQIPNLKIEGIFTHFARADEYDRNPAMVQLSRYEHFVRMLREQGTDIPLYHCSNSAGIIRISEGNMDAVRAGITIYGIYPSEEVERDILKLIPALELKSHVSYVKKVASGTAVSYGGTFITTRETKIATIPVGYADGYPRQLSNKGWVLIHEKKAPVLGRICMDQFMVDVTDIPDVKTGDVVTLIGRDGEEYIHVDTLGELSGRFSYEFLCGISKRVPRVYIKGGKEWGERTFFD